MSSVRDFFVELDAAWGGASSAPIRLDIIGSAALMLAEPRYQRGTKDGDVFETLALGASTKARLLELAGAGTALHRRRRMYIDIVANGIPFLPHRPQWVPCTPLNARLTNLELHTLSVPDVVVSKLIRFSQNDQDDIDGMNDHRQLTHHTLVERFRAAVDAFATEARADQLPQIIENFHRVERDVLGVEETEIELPGWI